MVLGLLSVTFLVVAAQNEPLSILVDIFTQGLVEQIRAGLVDAFQQGDLCGGWKPGDIG